MRKRTPDRRLDEAGQEPPTTAEYRPTFTAPAPAELAKHFPHLEILQLLGQGGMGAVYQARQTKLDRLVALKILPSESGRDPAFAARFQREARALGRLSDPHIVAVHDFGDAGGLFYFLMEYVDGVNLRQLMKAGALPPVQVLPLVGQICDALQYAHDQGIIHRDIKPENILVDHRGRVKIADFGLAKLLGFTTAEQPLTASMQVMGTWHYMAPEQIETPLHVDHRADIYSLGVVFYEMLTGSLPLGRFALPSQKIAIDPRLDEVIVRALERDPDRRYQQISQLKSAMETLGSPGPMPATAVFSVAPELPTVDKEAIRNQLQGPAKGLLATGLLGFVSAIVGGFALLHFQLRSDVSRPAGLEFFWLPVLSLPAYGVILVAALRMRKLESHGLAVTGSILAMIPWSLVWPLGLPMGVWALAVLKKPEVKVAFGVMPVTRKAKPGRLKQWFADTTNVAVIVCVLGMILCLPYWRPGRYGFAEDEGKAVLVTLGILLGTLLSTGFMQPLPFWRPLALMLAGTIVAYAMVIFCGYWSDSIYPTAYGPFAMGIVLLFLGFLQLRGVLMRKYKQTRPTDSQRE